MTDRIALEWEIKPRHQITFDLDDSDDLRELAYLIDPNAETGESWFEGTDDEWDALVEAGRTPELTKDIVLQMLDKATSGFGADGMFGDSLIQMSSDATWVDCDPGDIEVTWFRRRAEGGAA